MKNLFKTAVVMIIMLFVALSSFAQGQFDAIKKLGEGEYQLLEVNGTNTKKTVTLTFSNTDDPRLFTVNLKWNRTTKFMLDEPGYGASIASGPVQHAKLKYQRSKESGSVRMVVMEEAIYYLQSYKGPNDFSLLYKFTKKNSKKKKMSFKERLKAEKAKMKAGMANSNVDYKSKVKDFLKQELAAQAGALPKWKAANKDYYEQLKKDEEIWKGLLKQSDKQRDKMFAEERARKKRFSGGGDKSDKFTFKNNTGKTIKVLGDNCCVKTIYNGSSETFSCNDNVHTVVMKGSSNERGSVICSGKNYCGKTFVYGSNR